MTAPISYKIALSFKGIDAHPAFPFIGDKWKLFAKKLSEKSKELSSLPPNEYARKYEEYVAALTNGAVNPRGAFDKFQAMLDAAGKKQLGLLGYSDSQIRKLYAESGKESRNRILVESISADIVSIGPSGKLTVFEASEKEVVTPAPASAPEEFIPVPGGSGADLLGFAEEVATKVDVLSSYAGSELVDAAASITPGMSEEDVRSIFSTAEVAFFDAVEDLEAEAPGEAETFQEELEPLVNEVIATAIKYAQSEEEEPLEAPSAPPTPSADPLLEEELRAETKPASEELTALAADVVALAQQANRPTSFHLSELATEITAAGAPALAQQVLAFITRAPSLSPGFANKAADQLIKVGEKKYGLSGPILVKMGETFRTSLPSAVLESANGIYLSLQKLNIIAADASQENALSVATTQFKALEDVKARSAIFTFATIAARNIANRGVYPLLPAKIIGVERPVEPTGIVASGPDPEGAAEEAREAAQGVVAPSKPLIPPKPSPLQPNEKPSLPSPVPSQGQLIELIAGTRGDATKYLPLIATTYNGYGDVATIAAALQVWFKGLLSQPNNSFVIRWTTAPPPLDIVGATAFEMTHQLSAAADGNQNPNGAMWRKVAIPVKRLQEQTRAYLEGAALVKSQEQYDVEFAGASLQGPPQDTVSGVPASLTTPYYYIGTDDEGVMAVHITPDALSNVMESSAFTTVGDVETVSMTVSNAFGTVTVFDEEPLYLIEGPPLSVTGFLVVLEKYRLASCGSVICVSALLTEEAEYDEVTVEGIQQGATALINGWKNAFSSTLIVEVESVVFTKNKKGQFSARVRAGDAAYNLEVLIRAVPAPEGVVKYGACIREGGNELFQFTSTLPYSEFVRGTQIALKVADKAMQAGIEFGAAEKVVTMSGDGLSSDDFSSILDELRVDLQSQLQATARTGMLLNGNGNGGKPKATTASQPRA